MAGEGLRTVIIANPGSANGALGRRFPELKARIQACIGPVDHRFTEGPGRGAAAGRAAVEEGYELIVPMGGDGTISEVVDGLFSEDGPRNPEVILGFLPFGTGGDFRKTAGIPKDPEVAARLLAGRATRAVDVGRMTFLDHEGRERVRHFINIASFGVSGLVDEYVNRSSKLLGGRVSFAWASFKAMRRYQAQRVRLSLDDGPEDEQLIQTVAVANGRYFGGGMMVAPSAELDDGRFDVIAMGPMTVSDFVLKGSRIYKGTHLGLPGVTQARASRVRATPCDPTEVVLLDVDGETPGRLPATFEIRAKALKLKVADPG